MRTTTKELLRTTISPPPHTITAKETALGALLNLVWASASVATVLAFVVDVLGAGILVVAATMLDPVAAVLTKGDCLLRIILTHLLYR
jgi:hypothetical protein